MKYIYGPVNSRRIGRSLGVSLTPLKICSFDCVYCQLGRACNSTTVERREYIKIEEVIEELKSWFANNPEEAKQLNFITISGMGEPTLHSRLGEFIAQAKKVTNTPIALITNSSLLTDASVRKEILAVDLIAPSLDAATDAAFQRVDRPHQGIKLEGIIEGLFSLKKEFRGKIWLEVMLVKGVNDDLRHIKRLKEAVDKIDPDKIQLNSPVRSPSKAMARSVGKNKLAKIKGILGAKCEII